MIRRLLCVMLVTYLYGAQLGQAAPETSIRAGLSLTGSLSGARFGSEVTCSEPVAGGSPRSFVAVGAPRADAGRGRVLLFDPSAGSSPTQTLAPGAAEVAQDFGAALQFIDDINGDGVDDLVVGAPGGAATSGKVFAYLSTPVGAGVEYSVCGAVAAGVGFGTRLQGLRQAAGVVNATIVVANPTTSELFGYEVSVTAAGVCSFSPDAAFTESGVAGTEYGASLAQVAAGSSVVGVVVAAPGSGALGATSLLREAAAGAPLGSVGGIPTPVGGVGRSGTVVAGYYGSSLYAVGAPGADSDRGMVSVYSSGDEVSPAICSVTLAGGAVSDRFGEVVAHLDQTFSGLVGAGNVAVAASVAESESGGAVKLFGAASTGCAGMAVFNNCQSDSLQEQGAAIAGGAGCVAIRSGVSRTMLLVGAPGWSGERGRVDIAFEGDELSAPESCNATPTSTPEPTATLTPTPTATYTFTSVASATATFTSIATVTPTVTITLTVEPTSSTTPRPATTVTPLVTGDATPGGSGGVITDATPTPIVVFPGAQGLPTPEVSQAGDTLIVRLPPVTPELPASLQKRALRSVMKRNRKLSRKQAQELLADPNNLVVTYIVYISKVEEVRLSRFSLIESAHAAPKTRNLRERIRKLRARKNAVAITRIQTGASYRVYYEAEIALKKPRMVVGKTKPSGSTVFRTS